MAEKEMYDYLSDGLPDYAATTLSVTPQRILPEDGYKNIENHEADDTSEESIILSTQSIFNIRLQWDAITESESGTIFDFYHDPTKGCGTARSFYWTHPKDGHTYVVKFRGVLSRLWKGGDDYGISQIGLKVISRKPD